MDEATFERIFAVAAALEQSGLPKGVQAVTVGNKRTAGATTEVPSLVFLVDEKLPSDQVHEASQIPKEISGIATDVVELKARPQPGVEDPYQRVDRLVGGVSIKADWKRGLGTMGGVFLHQATQRPMGLTNRHVVDNWLIRANGQQVFQPSEAPGNRIGLVHKHDESWDCASITLDLDRRQLDLQRSFLGQEGRIVAIERAKNGMAVFKVGARTKRTEGVVNYSGPSAVVIHRVAGRPHYALSDAGDSGSVWAYTRPDGNHVAVALHWGGEDGVASCKPMIEVARALGLVVL